MEFTGSEFSSFLFDPGTTWPQQLLSQGPRSMGTYVARWPMELAQPPPSLWTHAASPTVLVSSSEVRWEEEFSCHPGGVGRSVEQAGRKF